MKRQTSSLAQKEYDVLVVGGGIFGAFATWDAALRGLRVAIVERGDFSQATSSNHFKVVHGGIRYMQHADFLRVRQSSRERSTLLRIAPHLVYPLPIILPTYGHGNGGKGILRLGCSLYDLLTLDRNRGLHDRKRRIPSCRFLTSSEVLKHFPRLDARGLTGGLVFYDGQIYNPTRLVMSAMRSAVAAGAHAANYMEVTRFLRRGRRVVGAEVQDREGGAQLTVRARVVLNATGPWAPRLLRDALGLDLGHLTPTFSRDVAIVSSKQLSPTFGLGLPTVSSDGKAILDRGGRHLLMVPWRGNTLVGVWHGVHSGSIDEPYVGRDEVQQYVSQANAVCPGLGLRLDDVQMVYAGLVLSKGQDQVTDRHFFGTRSILIDHSRTNELDGLITLIGVRATVARQAAERAVDLIVKKLRLPSPPCATHRVALDGGNLGDWKAFSNQLAQNQCLEARDLRRSIAHNYGTVAHDLLALGLDDPDLLKPLTGTCVLKAEIVHAVREEMALTLEDAVLRRTELGTAGTPGEVALSECANIMGKELRWTNDDRLGEIKKLHDFFAKCGMLRKASNGEVPAYER